METYKIYYYNYLQIPSLQAYNQGLIVLSVLYTTIFLLNKFVPGTQIQGYVVDYNNKPKQYTLNAFRIIVSAAIIGLYFKEDTSKYFYQNFNGNFYAALTIGLIFSFIWFLQGRFLLKSKNNSLQPQFRAPTVDQQQTQNITEKDWEQYKNRSLLESFYLGHRWNPSIYGVDFKMYLYLIGAVTLHLNIIGQLGFLVQQQGQLLNGQIVYYLLFTFFLLEYCWAEHVHTYTYDIFYERIGFKLSWGCLCFYPFVYCIGMFSLQNQNNSDNDFTPIQTVLVIVLYFIGWVLTRGANMQKYYCKVQPDKKYVIFGLIKQEFVPGSNKRLLCSGFWKVARHINYFGEIIQSLALALPGFYLSGCVNVIPFVYVIYYIGLFIPRAIADNNFCRQKYGDKIWDSYVEQVPYNIIPYVY